MKYLTKEWQIAVQNTHRHEALTASAQAAVFSEEFFQELYEQSEQEYLDFQRSICAIDAEALAEKFSAVPTQRVDGTPLTPEEQSFAASAMETIAAALRNAPPRTFDPEKAKQEHRRRFTEGLEQLKYIYPPEILAKVADMRVLALNCASPEVLAGIRSYCLQNRAYVESALDASRATHQKNWAHREPDFFKHFHFHDNRVLSLQNLANDVLLSFNNNEACLFKNAAILKNDGSLEDAIWEYDEIYPVDGGYEVHALLLTVKGSPFTIDDYSDLILRCSDIEIFSADHPFPSHNNTVQEESQ